jgi:hypothetical protein
MQATSRDSVQPFVSYLSLTLVGRFCTSKCRYCREVHASELVVSGPFLTRERLRTLKLRPRCPSCRISMSILYGVQRSCLSVGSWRYSSVPQKCELERVGSGRSSQWPSSREAETATNTSRSCRGVQALAIHPKTWMMLSAGSKFLAALCFQLVNRSRHISAL